MARIASKPEPLSFAISYGLFGGPVTGRKLHRLMMRAGFSPAASLGEADIIIAHSAGCWLIEPEAKPRLILHVGMPLAQTQARRTFAKAHRRNVWSVVRHGHWASGLHFVAASIYYGFRQPGRNRSIIKMATTAQPYLNPAAQTVFVVNRYDPWPRSAALQSYLAVQDWAFVSLTGSHDNIWEQPDRYVALINHYARLLA